MILPFSAPKIRFAEEKDAEEIAALYAPFVLETDITFETEAPDKTVFKKRIAETCAHYPWYVLEVNSTAGKTVFAGYAYASAQGTRAAYGWNAQYSIYLADFARGTGAAQALYYALEETLKAQGCKTAYALITQPNNASTAFHKKWGFIELTVHKNTGYKNGKWIDVLWMQKQLGTYEIPAKPVIPFMSLGSPNTDAKTFLCGILENAVKYIRG